MNEDVMEVPQNPKTTLRTRISNLEGRTTNNYNMLQNLQMRVITLEKEVGIVLPTTMSKQGTGEVGEDSPSLMSRATNEERLTTQDTESMTALANRVLRLESTVGIPTAVLPPTSPSSN